MIYEYDNATGKIVQHRSAWHPKELELERMILSDEGSESNTLNEAIFGEPLLLVSNQVINRNSRIILVAQAFDPALFSMGEWLAEHGVAFRCIAYTPVEIERKRLLAFSWRFDRAPRSLFPVIFGSQIRQPGVFWHNIGAADDGWWAHLKAHEEISASFDCAPGDEGERILKSYVAGDTVLAYATGFGAVGFAIVENPSGYKLLSPGDKDDMLNGRHLHRLPVKWKAVAPHLREAIAPDELRQAYNIYHPRSTSVPVDIANARDLTNDMQTKWPRRTG